MLQAGVVQDEAFATAVNSHQGLGHCKVMSSDTPKGFSWMYVCCRPQQILLWDGFEDLQGVPRKYSVKAEGKGFTSCFLTERWGIYVFKFILHACPMHESSLKHNIRSLRRFSCLHIINSRKKKRDKSACPLNEWNHQAVTNDYFGSWLNLRPF